MIRVGSIAPDIQLLLDSGERFRLESLRGNAPLVLMFLPSDSSVDLRRDGYEFIQHLQEAASIGARLLAVSPGPLDSLKEFVKLYAVPVQFARDEQLKVCRNYGVVWLRGSAIRRVTFVIDARGIIRAGVPHDLLPNRHWRGILRVLHEHGAPPNTSTLTPESA